MIHTGPVTLAELRSVDLFDGIDDEQLAEWLAVAQLRDVAAGELIVEEQEHTPGLILLLEGTVITQMSSRGRPEPLGHQRAPTWIGAISVLTEDPLPVRIVAESACRLAIIQSEEFLRLIFAQRPVHQTVIRQISPVLQRLGGIEQNRERLASLGRMAAGLTHELNNPAAAARRAASQLAEEVGIVQSTLVKFVKSGVERADAEKLVELQEEAIARAEAATALQTLDAADAEDELLERLEALDVPEPWRLVEPLSRAGLDQDWLDRVVEHAGKKATPAALHWVAATLTIGRVSSELCESTDRISELVGAVKDYAYMDRGGLVEVDLHEGLETTLTLFKHKIKHTAIKVVRDYDRDLPRMTVRGSELNQVWTNLLDNAIGALGEQGTITIRTSFDEDCAVVEISDDGPGIPEDVRERIFDPFFTTKDVGLGTGLGLATSRQVVVERHNGSLAVDSEPGNTTFRVRLPLTQG
jgi:signal transduction histidine kinase